MNVDAKNLHAYRREISLLGNWTSERRREIELLMDSAHSAPPIKSRQYAPEVLAFITDKAFAVDKDNYSEAVMLLQQIQHENYLELIRSYYAIWHDHRVGQDVEITGRWPNRED